LGHLLQLRESHNKTLQESRKETTTKYKASYISFSKQLKKVLKHALHHSEVEVVIYGEMGHKFLLFYFRVEREQNQDSKAYQSK